MYKIVKLGGKLYAHSYPDYAELVDEIEEHVACGEPVIVVGDLEDAEVFGLDVDKIEVVGWGG